MTKQRNSFLRNIKVLLGREENTSLLRWSKEKLLLKSWKKLKKKKLLCWMETVSVSLNDYIWRKWGHYCFFFFFLINRNDFEVFNMTGGLAVRFPFLFMLQCAMGFQTKRVKKIKKRSVLTKRDSAKRRDFSSVVEQLSFKRKVTLTL